LGKYSPRFLQRQLRKGFSNLMQMQKDLPRQANHILSKLEEDQLSIRFEHKNLDGMRLTLDRIANRLTLGIITGCMIIGSSMIITTGVPPFIFGYPALGLVGYLLAACVGFWLVIDILRRRKM
ncbi:MAG: ABC transporter, partial [Desulfovermiculus sp.]|nr:ABC transporter [Desulfovermiculus sp.]